MRMLGSRLHPRLSRARLSQLASSLGCTPHAIPVCGSSVWVLCVGPVCGSSVWSSVCVQCVGPVCGSSVWVQCVGPVCGSSVRVPPPFGYTFALYAPYDKGVCVYVASWLRLFSAGGERSGSCSTAKAAASGISHGLHRNEGRGGRVELCCQYPYYDWFY